MEREIQAVCDEIVALVHPRRVILFNQKKDLGGKLSAFKLCLVVDDGQPEAVEREIYLHVECGIPYDVLVYRSEDWDEMASHTGSFASRIAESGSAVYEQAE